MFLPRSVHNCIARLEQAGYAAYCVGGCVRDSLLGLQPHDYDLCTAATPDEIQHVFSDEELVLAGLKHGTVGVITPDGVVEITTFRTEGGYEDHRHPSWVRFVTSIEEDLSRRDFTVNAMAWSPTRGFADPFGGREDLKNGVLRAVGSPRLRFTEDALRILRGVRFSVRYGLTPEPETEKAMTLLAPELDTLAVERVFEELCKLIVLVNAKDLLRFAPVLIRVIPELEPALGFDQHSPYHAYDLFTHIAHVVESVPPKTELRLAALLHDVGKVATFTRDELGRGHFYGHAQTGAQIANTILHRLKAPTALREQVVRLIDLHMTRIEPEKKAVKRWLGKLGSETMDALLLLQEADMSSKGTGIPGESDQFPALRAVIAEILAEEACLSIRDLAVNGSDLIAMGFRPGKAIGACLQHLLEQVLDDNLENEKQTLLQAAKAFLNNQLTITEI